MPLIIFTLKLTMGLFFTCLCYTGLLVVILRYFIETLKTVGLTFSVLSGPTSSEIKPTHSLICLLWHQFEPWVI